MLFKKCHRPYLLPSDVEKVRRLATWPPRPIQIPAYATRYVFATNFSYRYDVYHESSYGYKTGDLEKRVDM